MAILSSPRYVLYCSIAVLSLFLSHGIGPMQGRVSRVVDGDTFVLVEGKNTFKIRLQGIDAPERGQAYGKKATEYLMNMVQGKTIRAVVHNKDPFGRYVADVFLTDGTQVNYALVKAGYAWHFKKYSKDMVLANLEAQARQSGMGLWQEKSPLPPWEFRKRKSVPSKKK